MHRRSKYDQKYKSLKIYRRKQRRTKVKKHFMTPQEFLGIYELYVNAKIREDLIFLAKLIQTSKTYKHYKKSIVCAHHCLDSVENIVLDLLNPDKTLSLDLLKSWSTVIMEWLFSHTVHANSLNSVTFK